MTEVEQHHQFLTAVGICRWFSVWYQWSKEAWMENKVITHTCSEQSLRILMWNASYVQKTLQLTGQERVDDTIRERLKSNPCLVTARSNWSIWTKSFSLYWQLRNTDCDNSAVKRETLQKIDMPVLGLAGLPLTTKWKLEDDQSRYHNLKHSQNHRLRWAVDGMRFTAPLHEIE